MDVGGTLGSVGAASMTGYLSEHGFAGGWPSAFYVSGKLRKNNQNLKELP